jgi:glycosyltransferase involved in cell wall biosynthesis
MKILHVLQNYEPSKGGTQFLFKNVSEILVKKYNYEVIVFTTNSMFDPGSNIFERIDPEFEIINNVRIHRFPFYRFHRYFLKNLNKFLFKIIGSSSNHIASLRLGPWSPKFRNSLKEINCDVICGSSSQYYFMNYGIWRANYKIKNPFVFMGAIHFDDEKNISLPKHILQRINSSDKYISNTIFEKECLTKLGVEPNKIDVIGCGVNIQEFGLTSKKQAREIIGLSEQDFVVGYVGRFAINKDIVTLIKSFGDNCQENWKLVLAGGQNEYLNFLKSYVNENYQNLFDRIIFIVNFEDSLKEKLYACMDLFVCPSYSESFGIVFLEAWASKLPVIGTNIGAIRTIIEDGQNGRIFSVSNSIQLADLLNYYYKNIEIRHTHGLAGFELVSQNFTWEIIAKKYRNTYLEAIHIFNNNKKCVA